MARILFTWELGEGNGHIVPHFDLLSRLVKKGHQVYLAAKNLSVQLYSNLFRKRSTWASR